jgi:hypothetical protein
MKNLIAGLLATLLIFSITTPVLANGYQMEQISNDDQFETQSLAEYFWKLARDFFCWIADQVYHKVATPTIQYQVSRDVVTSGAVRFAGYQGSTPVISRVNKEYFAMVPKGVTLHQVTVFATSGATNFNDPISIVIQQGHTMLFDRILQSNAHATYEIPLNRTGAEHQIQYTCVVPKIWDVKFFYYHWGDTGPILQSLDGNDTSIDNYTIIDDKVYVHPSDSRSVNANFNKLTSYITINNLIFYEFYDDEIGFVNVARNYVAGDTILIRDTILSTEYNRSEDYTTFVFYPHERLYFSGDLTSIYSPGDVIHLHFKLLTIPNSDVFVELDYVRQGRTNGIPNINRYLHNSKK